WHTQFLIEVRQNPKLELCNPKQVRLLLEARAFQVSFGGWTFKVNPCTAAISAASPFPIGISLTAFQYSPSTKVLPPRESIGVNAITFLPTIVSAPAFTGKSWARKPFPTTKIKNSAVMNVAGMM